MAYGCEHFIESPQRRTRSLHLISAKRPRSDGTWSLRDAVAENEMPSSAMKCCPTDRTSLSLSLSLTPKPCCCPVSVRICKSALQRTCLPVLTVCSEPACGKQPECSRVSSAPGPAAWVGARGAWEAVDLAPVSAAGAEPHRKHLLLNAAPLFAPDGREGVPGFPWTV